MERKEFIRSALLAFGSAVAVPVAAKMLPFTSDKPLMLKQNVHIRHGLYNNTCTVNVLDETPLGSIRIDRFRNADGDLLLYELHFDEERLIIGLTDQTLMVDDGYQLSEFDKDASHHFKIADTSMSLNVPMSEAAFALDLTKGALYKLPGGLIRRADDVMLYLS